jgi:hypothetical protein
VLPLVFLFSAFVDLDIYSQFAYGVGYVGVGLIFLWSSREPYEMVFLQTYLLMAVLFTVVAYRGLFFSPESPAASLIMLFSLAPMVCLDKPVRINTMMVICLILYGICCYINKPLLILRNDMINLSIAGLTGMMLGNHMRQVKFMNHEMRRQAEYQKYIDSLTGLYNRNKMYEVLEKGWRSTA